MRHNFFEEPICETVDELRAEVEGWECRYGDIIATVSERFCCEVVDSEGSNICWVEANTVEEVEALLLEAGVFGD